MASSSSVESGKSSATRPAWLGAGKTQPPHQSGACRLDGEQQVLQTSQALLIRRRGKGGKRALDALVVDQATVDRQHGVRTEPVEAEAPAVRLAHGLELAADAITPCILHAEHGGVGRQP